MDFNANQNLRMCNKINIFSFVTLFGPETKKIPTNYNDISTNI